MLFRYGLALCLLVVAPLALLMAGTTGKIAGTVTDRENGEPLIGANISLDGTMLGASTDIDGSFFILNVPPGSYTMVVDYIGYQTSRLGGVQVSIDLTTRQDVRMSTETIALDEEIVVTANREILVKDLTSSEARVSAEKIEALPASNIDQVLQIQAGVTKDAGGGFHIRGGRSSEIAYWVNGVSITDGYDNSRGLVIENESVQELQVISGTFNAEYGNAMSGIINIVTKEGESNYHGSIEAYSGDHITRDNDRFYNLDDVSPVENYSLQGSLSGPVPGTGDRVRFYATSRINYDDGYLYGARIFNTNGTLGQEIDFSEFETQEEIEAFINSDEFPKLFDAVPMNPRETVTGLGKLTFYAAPTLKLSAEGFFSREEYQDYDHQYRFMPEALLNKMFNSFSGSFVVNHTLSNRTFYTVNLTYLDRDFEEYLYEDPLDPRYMEPPSTQGDAFHTSGTNNHRFTRATRQYIGKLDVTSQMHSAHLIKAGVEFKRYDLFQDDFDLEIPVVGSQIPDVTSVNRDRFQVEPIQMAAYIQDKIEFESVIINAGLRLDYFDPKGQILADTRDPDIFRPTKPEHIAMTLEERQAIWYKDAEVKYQLSPRLGIAYPISESGVIHFSFGHFLQIPELRQLYQNASFKISQVSGQDAPFGNPDLKAQQTVQYEIGLQQQLSEDVKIDVTAFYRDIRDWVTTGSQIDTYLAGTRYSQFVNKDYANVRGVTMQIDKRLSGGFGVDFVYQYQVAEGTNSSPDEEFNAQNSNFEANISLLPLDWDQTHNFSTVLYYGSRTWGASLLGRFNSGLPYTPEQNFEEESVGAGVTSDIAKNSLRKPNNLVVDLSLHRNFNVDMLEFKVFANVFNLLDRRNEINVYTDTGRADFTLDAPGVNPFFYVRSDYFDAPREVQVGMEVSF